MSGAPGHPVESVDVTSGGSWPPCAVTLDELRHYLDSDDLDERAYWVGKVMRQAKPDDALVLVRPADMRGLWPRLERFLGTTKPFWAWLLPRLSR